MKRFISQLIVIASVIFIAASCQQAPFITMTGPRSFTFTRDGGTQSFSFACNREWSVSSTESWITVSPSKGSATDGETKVTITCSPNTTYDARSATITVKVAELSETISITQDTGLGLIVSPKSFDLTNAAQTIEIEVQKNVQYSITIDDAGKSWITHTGTKGLSSEKASFNIAANETYDNREAKITFKQTDGGLVESVTICQNQTNGLFVTTPSYDLSNEMHTLTVEVKANVEYSVTIDDDWIKYESSSTKALTSSYITLRVAANNTYNTREGHVIVKQTNGELSGTIVIRQDESHGIFVSSSSANISKDEQKVEVAVKYNVDFDVIIPEDAKGTMITSVEYSDGNENTKALSSRTYRFGVSENKTYDPREVSITFKQKDGSLSDTFTISQEEKKTVLVSKNHFDIQPSGGTFDIKVSFNTPYSVEIKDNTWITQVATKALSEETISFSVSENTQESERQGTITISAPDINVKKEITVMQYGSGYYKGDVLLMSIADLDNFNSQNVKVIDGDLVIKNSGWTSQIEINDCLVKVLGTIQIEGESAIISGLNNIKNAHSIKLIKNSSFNLFTSLSEIDGDFYYSHLEPNITSFEGLEWLTKVGGNFSIVSTDAYNGFNNVTSFSGLENLVSIGGDFSILGFFGQLSNFEGFSNLESIGGNFSIKGNGFGCYSSLKNFYGFNSLKKIGGDFLLKGGMLNLQNFVGLEHLEEIGGHMLFSGNWGRNSLLTSLTSFKGLENLKAIRGRLQLYVADGPIPLSSFADLKSLKVLGGLLVGENSSSFTSLNMDSFAGLPLKEIGKYGVELAHSAVMTGGEIIYDLNWMRNIESIEGSLYIGVPNIASLQPLKNLKRIGGFLCINETNLKSLDGLENITISGCDYSTQVYATNVFCITNNAQLKSFSAIRNALDSYVSLQTSFPYGWYNVSGNKYNPTYEQILNGEGNMD